MITGHATAEATAVFADRNSTPTGFCCLGRTGLKASRAGFEGYRIGAGVIRHQEALTAALRSGINLIDTSANYADGGSESLVGQVLQDLTAAGEVDRQQAIIISKVGYLQGENFALSQHRKSEGRPFQDLDWKQAETLSQKAIRALRSTSGVSSVLVGMRNTGYVKDVLAELGRPVAQADRSDSWKKLTQALAIKDGAV